MKENRDLAWAELHLPTTGRFAFEERSGPETDPAINFSTERGRGYDETAVPGRQDGLRLFGWRVGTESDFSRYNLIAEERTSMKSQVFLTKSAKAAG